jgi:malate dehydrogenase
MNKKKIALIGAGQIGGTLALLCTQRGLGDIVLFDVFGKTAQGKALDLNQASTLLSSDYQLLGTDKYSDIKDADVCIVTAGFPRKPGMSRDDLLEKNLNVITQVADGIKTYAPNAFVVLITNPLDIMVYAFYKCSQLKKNKIVGMAGVLDSTRFRTFLSWELGISREDITTMVLGGHGDDMVPLTKYSTVNGISLDTLVDINMLSRQKLNQIIERTRKGGGEIVGLLGTGSAFYSPALSAIKMIESFLNDKKRLMPCAALLSGEYGVDNLFLGVPVIIGKDGIEKVIELPLSQNEKKEFDKSVQSVQKCVNEVNEKFKINESK